MDETGFNHFRRCYRSVHVRGSSQILFLAAATNFLLVFNMSATIGAQGSRVQLKSSKMHLALNMAKMATRGYSHTPIQQMQYLMKKPHAEVREERKLSVEFPEHTNVKAAIEWHPAIVHEYQTDGCLLYQNGTAINMQTHWRLKATGAPPPGLTWTADTRSDATASQNATCTTRWQYRSWNCPNRWCASWICVYTYCTSQCPIFQSWCQGSQVQQWFYSRFSDSSRDINCLVQYLLHSNVADIDYADRSSLLSETASGDEHQ